MVFRKYDGSLHWHQRMRRLGADRHGVWLGAPEGTKARRNDEPPITVEHAHVMLFPLATWWTAVFNAAPAPVEVYCDVTTPVRWPSPAEVTMVDLDLDVLRRRVDGQVLLDDADEFAEHQLRYAYPPQVIASATAAADWLMAAVGGAVEPFATEYRAWLDLVA